MNNDILNINSYIQSCVFCSKFGHSGTGSGKKEWFDRELITRSKFVVVPGIGPLKPGYLLILHREHISSFAQMSLPEILILKDLKNEIKGIVAKHFESPIIFEHGPKSTQSRTGNCIDHAHLHIHPLKEKILDELNIYHEFKEIKEFENIKNYCNHSYLYFEDNDGRMFISTPKEVQSQFFRKIIASRLGFDEMWDYAVFPNYPLIKYLFTKLAQN
jgi:diadenosine tetraphosphate (Ap4A) HIT family hydrolase